MCSERNSPPTYSQAYGHYPLHPHLQSGSYQPPEHLPHHELDAGGRIGYTFFAPFAPRSPPMTFVYARSNSYPGPSSAPGASSFHSRHASYPTRPLRWIASSNVRHDGNPIFYDTPEDSGPSMYEVIPPQYEVADMGDEGSWEGGSSDLSDHDRVEPATPVTVRPPLPSASFQN